MKITKRRIAEVVFDLPIEGPFDYLLPQDLCSQASIGSRVSVPFGRQTRIGYVVQFKEKSPYRKLKSIFSLIDETALLSDSFLTFTKEFSSYYACSWGEAIAAGLPKVLRSGKPVSIPCSLNAQEKKSLSRRPFFFTIRTGRKAGNF